MKIWYVDDDTSHVASISVDNILSPSMGKQLMNLNKKEFQRLENYLRVSMIENIGSFLEGDY